MSHEQEPELYQEPVPISRASFMLLLIQLPWDEQTEALLARVEYGDSNNLLVEFLFDGSGLSVKLSEKKSMMFRRKK